MINKGITRIFLALFVISVFLFQSCMTIFRGSSQNIPVTSNPMGAKIIVDGEEMGNAPLNLKLKRKKDHVIIIGKQGYTPLCNIQTFPYCRIPKAMVSIQGFALEWGEERSCIRNIQTTPSAPNR